MVYLVGDNSYHFSYKECKEKYLSYIELSNEEFLERLPEILHFACFMSYLKELGPEASIGDEGIVHELIHLLHIPHDANLKKIRKQFKHLMKLA